MDIPKRKRGRPPRVSIDNESLANVSPEEMVDKLAESISITIEQLRIKAATGGITAKEVMTVGKLARILETCARAKNQLIEAQRGGDLSGIPSETLARVVVRAMRNDVELRQAIEGEMKKGAAS